MEGNKDINILLPRTEFSDFVVNSSRQYFNNLVLPQQQKERMARMLLIPYGSIARGNASELTSDLDLFMIEDNPASYEESTLPFIDGSYNPDKISLGKYLLDEYEKKHPGTKEIRRSRVHPDYVDEVEVDTPHPLFDDLLQSVDDGSFTNCEGDTISQGGGHSGAVFLGFILYVDPKVMIAGSPELLDRIRAKIRNHLKDKPEAQMLIAEEYNYYLRWDKASEDY